jgi:DNA-binding IclR family transcriptional regulator
MSTEKKVQVVPALEKALDILEYIAERGDFVSTKEISAELGIPIATTYRTVNYLCNRNYLRENPDLEGNGYSLGAQIQILADHITRQFDLISVALPSMRRLAAQSEQTVQLGILQEHQVIYIEQVLPAKPVNIIAALRTGIAVNVSASGKVLVAHLPPQEQNDFLEKAELEPRTKRSITAIEQFRDELLQVKKQGYATDNEEFARGIGCVAVPIRNSRGQVIAAIGITGHSAEYTGNNWRNTSQLVRDAGRAISSNIIA